MTVQSKGAKKNFKMMPKPSIWRRIGQRISLLQFGDIRSYCPICYGDIVTTDVGMGWVDKCTNCKAEFYTTAN